MKRLIAAAALIVFLSACMTPTPYQPRGGDGYGFAEQRIEGNRFVVTFRGNTLTSREQVADALLYRAAELTLAEGFDYFLVSQRDVEGKSELRSYGGMSFMSDAWLYSPRRGWRGFYDPFWDNSVSFREVTRYEARMEILLQKGGKPAADAQAFDARAVQQNLAARIIRPAPKA